jgi:hypothetical protein
MQISLELCMVYIAFLTNHVGCVRNGIRQCLCHLLLTVSKNVIILQRFMNKTELYIEI